MADLVVPGVWWLHGTRGSNVYLVEAGAELVLIDTGFGDSAQGIAQEVEEVAPGRAISKILLTHAHVDHAGAAGLLRKSCGAEVVAGRAECVRQGERWLLRERVGHSHWLRSLLAAALRRAFPVVIVDRVLAGEAEVAPGIVAVPVPGHTPGSYCYLDEARGVAFVGDLVISHVEWLARPLKMSNANDGLYLESLRKFGPRAPETGCPGHGAPVLAGFGEKLRELADLPRRRMPPFDPMRMRQLRQFGKGMSRRREKAADPPPPS
ncbi:MAG: MBL fold metallo-hydrolase, partial [Anaerolineaceae bacterium]